MNETLSRLKGDLLDDAIVAQCLQSLVAHVGLLDGIDVADAKLNLFVVNGHIFSYGDEPEQALGSSGLHPSVCQLHIEVVKSIDTGDGVLHLIPGQGDVTILRFKLFHILDFKDELVFAVSIAHLTQLTAEYVS